VKTPQLWVVSYTTAPEDYDWFGTHTLSIAGSDKRGKQIRKVTSKVEHVQAQRDRYKSGWHLTAAPEEWVKLVRLGLVSLAMGRDDDDDDDPPAKHESRCDCAECQAAWGDYLYDQWKDRDR
jgi:hypothetical protein